MDHPNIFTFDEIFTLEEIMTSNFTFDPCFNRAFLRKDIGKHTPIEERYNNDLIEEEANFLFLKLSKERKDKFNNFDLVKYETIDNEKNPDIFFIINKKYDNLYVSIIVWNTIPEWCTLTNIEPNFFIPHFEYLNINLGKKSCLVSSIKKIDSSVELSPYSRIPIIIGKDHESEHYSVEAILELNIDKTLIPANFIFRVGDFYVEEKYPFPSIEENEDAILRCAEFYIRLIIEDENQIVVNFSDQRGTLIHCSSPKIFLPNYNEKLREEYFCVLEVSDLFEEIDDYYREVGIILKEIVCNHTLLIYRKRYLPF